MIAGDLVTYTLTVTNHGPSDAAGVTLTDPLPADVAFVAVNNAAACAGGATVTCALGGLASGASVTVTITGRVSAALDSGARLSNTASVGSATPDPTTSNNTDTASSTVSTQADIAVTKTVAPVDGVAGAPMTFTITMTNNGASVARDVHLDDTVTVDFVFGTLPAGCDVTAGQLSCSLGDLDPGVTRVVTISGTVSPAADPGSYRNSVVASTATTDPVNADDSDSVDFTVRAESNASISKTGDSTLTAGDTFSYQIAAATAGPSDARDVTVTDTLPATLVLESVTTAQGSCTVAGQTITCDLGTIPAPAGSVLITITGDVLPDATGTVTNAATISTTTSDPDPGNSSSTVTADLVSSADLAVAKTPDTSPLIAGATVGYTITVTNQGPSNATGVVLTDVLPAAIAFDPDSSDPACALTAGSVTCTVGALAAEDTRVFHIVGQLSPSFLAAELTNAATVSSTTPDPDTTNDSVSVTTPVTTSADLDVTKLPSTQTPAAGETLTYTLTVANLGLSDAQAVTLSDTLPAGTAFVSASGDPPKPCTAGATTVTCDIGVLAVGASQTILVTVRLSTSLPPQALTNTATASSPTHDPVTDNNTATAAVQTAVIADLSVTKTLETPTPLVAGQPVTYTITVHNGGPSDAPDVLFSDTLPPGTSFLRGSAEQGTCGLNRADALTIVTCELATLPAGDSVSGTLTLATSPDLTGSLANTASTGSGALDPDATNNTSTSTASVTSQADLSVTKTVTPDPIVPGAATTWTITVHNAGPSTATGVTVTDPAPARVRVDDLTSSQGSCDISSATCELGSLQAGGTATVTLTGTPDPALTGTITNTATAASTTSDPDATNNTTTLTSSLEPESDLAITKTLTNTPVAGQAVGWLITVTNHGPSIATAATVTDAVPSTVTGVSATPSQGTCTVAASVQCSLGALDPAASATIRVTATILATAAGQLVNHAWVAAAPADPDPANNQATATAEIAEQPPPPSPSSTVTSGGTLAFTGLDVRAYLLLATVLLAAGAALLQIGRHRRRQE